ncbi:MAG: aminofutalosine synthase MqnE [Armatimonadetes bacterium]|nr:aminofutalosine synthase MqnE [Armatimonadota bacterium]MDW8120963.1 aminofutalosine synthase MqnE [Armatimonadota bacterium]
METLFIAPNLWTIAEKVEKGERLTAEEGIRLYQETNLAAVGFLADRVRRRLHSDIAYYVVNLHLSYSNVCFAGCPFCAFGKFPDDPDAFEYDVDGYLRQLERMMWDRVTEVHIVGGLHPDLPFDYYLNLVRAVKDAYPTIHLKAFTAVEVQYFSELSGYSVEKVLEKLKEAGLDALPGGGAEVLSDRLHRILFPKKASPQQWLNVHRTAHRMGIPSNATLLYGHIEIIEEKVHHLDQLRRLQDETGGFLCYIPLAYHPENTQLGGRRTTGVADLREVAVARLMLDNFPHIKAYWISLQPKLAQVALSFGADDMDGTVVNEKIFHMAGAPSPNQLTEDELRKMAQEAGFRPVRRNSHYQPLEEPAAIS